MWGTRVEFPPVDVTEKRVRPDRVAASVLKTHPLVHLLGQQPVTQRLGVLAEVLWIDHHPCQHALLHLLAFNLDEKMGRNILSPPPLYYFSELLRTFGCTSLIRLIKCGRPFLLCS